VDDATRSTAATSTGATSIIIADDEEEETEKKLFAAMQASLVILWRDRQRRTEELVGDSFQLLAGMWATSIYSLAGGVRWPSASCLLLYAFVHSIASA
jgi:hypothetical protein